MNRVLTALSSNRCVLALSAKACNDLVDTEDFQERSGHPWAVFGTEEYKGLPALTSKSLSPCIDSPGGLLVLVDPDFSKDASGFKVLEGLIKEAPNKPKILVLARMFNPFQLPMGLRLLKIDQLKSKSKEFLSGLPVLKEGDQSSVEEVKTASKKRSTGKRVPQPVFLGRETEKQRLEAALKNGGPVLLKGASGIGKHWLLEAVAGQSEEWTLLEEVALGSGVGFDSLAARLCEISSNKKILTAQGKSALSPKDLIKGVVTGLQTEGLEKLVLPISGIEDLLRRDGSLHKDDRLAMLLKALWTQKHKLPIVFLSSQSPKRLGAESTLETIEISGLTRDDIAALFEAYYVENVTEEHIDEVLKRTLGHPFAARLFVVAYTDEEKREKIFSKKFLQQKDLGDLDRLRNHLHLVAESLKPESRKALGLIAHTPVPMPAKVFSELGLNRAVRLDLIGQGLLDVNFDEHRRVSVHPLVSKHLSRRSKSDFDTYEKIADELSDRASHKEGDTRLAMNLWANLLYTRARKHRSVRNTGYPSADHGMEALRGMMRSKRQELATQRSNELVKRNPLNTGARLLQIEVLQNQRSDHNKIRDAYKEATSLCATPELYHHQASWEGSRKGGVPTAAKTLARAVAAFPHNTRLKRRLAGLTHEMGQYKAAESQLREAIQVEPDMPDTYVQLAQVLFELQGAPWTESESLLRQAIELDGEHKPAKGRLGALLRRKGMIDENSREGFWTEGKNLLEAACSKEARDAKAFIECGLLMLDCAQLGLESDLGKAEELFSRANKIKNGNSPAALVGLSRVFLRTDRIQEAAKALEKALKKHATHSTLAALGELYAFQGKIFRAEKEFREAWQQAPNTAPEKALYQLELTRLEGLIASGAAVEIENQAEGKALAEPALSTVGSEDGPRREAGKTVVRRKTEKKKSKKKAPPESAPPGTLSDAKSPEAKNPVEPADAEDKNSQ